MKLYLAPTSSLELIRYLRSTNGDEGLLGIPMRKRAIRDAINTVHAIDELDETAQRWLKHVQAPIHAFVPSRAKGTSTKHLVTHVHGGLVPHGAMLDLGHGVCICAPHLVFMRMAANADLVDAVVIGMELCGMYSLWRLAPAFLDSYYREAPETRDYTFDLPKATTLSRIEGFVERQQGQRGAVGARAALRWVLDNSASPMETATYLLLCLPKRLGGYGLPKPVLNPKINVSNPDGTKVRYPDLFWLGANIDVEYNSDKAHGGDWARYRDSKREVELTVGSVRVLPLTRHQLMSVDGFDAFAQGLRKMLGVRSRRNDAAWAYRRDELRQKLLMNWKLWPTTLSGEEMQQEPRQP